MLLPDVNGNKQTDHLYLFSRMAALPGQIFVFYQLRLSMEHHVSISINAPGWGSVNLSQFTHHPATLGYSYR